MAPALRLDSNSTSSVITKLRKNWVTAYTIDRSPLDYAHAYVYHQQLEELSILLASCAERTVEQFVAIQEMESLTDDFWVAVAVVKTKREAEETEKRDQQQQKQATMVKRDDAAKMWKTFRKMDV